MSKQFEFGGKLKKNLLIFSVVSLVLGVAWALYTGAHEGNHLNRLWSNLLLNTYMFGGIAIVGLFFVASHQLGYGGWQTVFKKVPLAMGKFLYIIFPLAIIITLAMVFDVTHIYSHWSIHQDAIVEGKSPFLNGVTYSVLVVGFFGLWALFAHLMNKHFSSVKSWKEYGHTKKLSALFLLVFGVSQSVLSWIFIMSLDPHWYSTLFGWYNFASYACAGFAVMILLLLALKKMGYMPNTTMDHIHDLGKYLFGFSVFWTYLWFSQFMLIWYANIPEATVWYSKRMALPLFKFIFFFAFILNFIVPFLGLIARDSKRKVVTMVLVCLVVIVGHYLDFYQMIMVEPMAVVEHHDDHHEDDNHAANNSDTEHVLYAEAGHSDSDLHADEDHDHEDMEHMEEMHADDHGDAHSEDEHHDDDHGAVAGEAHGDDAHGDEAHGAAVTHHASLGITELFMFLGFMGLFFYVVLGSLAGKELEMTDDPFLEESVHHHI